jgi:hypothetical protein
VDTLGNLYIADTGNQRVRKVDTSGNIGRIAGNGSSGYSIRPAQTALLRAYGIVGVCGALLP